MHYPGLVSISFRSHSPEEIIHEAVRANLTHIEWGSDVHAPCHDIPRLEHIAALQKQYGISCCSYGTYFRLGYTLSLYYYIFPLSTTPRGGCKKV